ncbi:hypothetical protein INR49_010527 [Caranx melampygus]|nr:hypothetical protein INR49_010527 [Caranx melampygus]
MLSLGNSRDLWRRQQTLATNKSMLHIWCSEWCSFGLTHFDSLEDVHCPFVTHPLQDNTQSDEDTCPPHASTTDIQQNMLLQSAEKSTDISVL